MSDKRETSGREDGRFPDKSYGGEGKGTYSQHAASEVKEGSLGGRQDARFPESSYDRAEQGHGQRQSGLSEQSGGGSDGFGGREDGRFPDKSYGGEGEGSYSQHAASEVKEGSSGGRQDGRFPDSSYDRKEQGHNK